MKRTIVIRVLIITAIVGLIVAGILLPINKLVLPVRAEEFTSPIESFTGLSRIMDADAFQGVASDGNYIYNTRSWEPGISVYALYKRDMDGNLLDVRYNPNLDGTSCNQTNGIFIKDGLLYVGAFTHLPDPRQSFLKVYDTDLNYIREIEVANGQTEGAYFEHGSWWVIYHNDVNGILQYDADWNFIKRHWLEAWNCVNGILWVGDYLYLNHHENEDWSGYVDVHHWNGSDFTFIGRIKTPTRQCSQGMYRIPGTDIVLWAERYGDGPGRHHIVISRINWEEAPVEPEPPPSGTETIKIIYITAEGEFVGTEEVEDIFSQDIEPLIGVVR